MKELTEDVLNEVAEMGKLGFSVQRVSEWLCCRPCELSPQFREQNGPVYEAYQRGRLEGMIAVRRAIMKAAEMRENTAIGKMMTFFRQSDNDNMEIWEE